MVFLNSLDRLRVERGAENLWRCDVRVLGEFFAEGIHEGDNLPRLLARFQRYGLADPEVVRDLGGNGFPPRLHLVPPR
jgi:hypothetical protein